MTRPTTALQAPSPGSALRSQPLDRRDLRPDDIAVRVDFCGICHTDLHALRADDPAAFPLVPGHEFVGEVSAVGDAVTDFAVGDPVAVGNIVDSCGECRWCRAGEEPYCERGVTLTYGGSDRVDETPTAGGYSGEYVVREGFAYPLPATLDPAAAAPLMCAGVTVWQPLRAAGVGPGTRVGVVGVGGLGHLAVRLAEALGAEVTAFTRSASKVEDARRLGADRVVVSTDDEQMAVAAATLDVIVDTVAAEHPLEGYLATLDADGVLFSVGHLGPVTVETMALLAGRKRLSSSGSGGRPDTRAMLELCGERGIVADVEVVTPDGVDDALERLAANDVRYRFVLDTRPLQA